MNRLAMKHTCLWIAMATLHIYIATIALCQNFHGGTSIAWTSIRTWTTTPLNFTYKCILDWKMRENQEFPVDFVGTNAGLTNSTQTNCCPSLILVLEIEISKPDWTTQMRYTGTLVVTLKVLDKYGSLRLPPRLDNSTGDRGFHLFPQTLIHISNSSGWTTAKRQKKAGFFFRYIRHLYYSHRIN